MSATPVEKRHAGFTLVELMVAIAIIAILAGLLLGVAATAGRTASASKTKSRIGQLHTLLMERYDLYRTRRVETRPFTDTVANRAGLVGVSGIRFPPVPSGDPRFEAMVRLAALREQMKIEMPDRWSDVIARPVALPPEPSDRPSTLLLETNPGLQTLYVRAYNQLVGRVNTVTGVINTREDILTNQGAECLYLIIMNATGDGEARSLFRESDVGDTDGDGAPEFLDGWRQPISFVRWAPGFDSDAQLSYPDWVPAIDSDPPLADVARSEITEDHDPYDLFRVDQPSSDNDDLQAGEAYAGLRGWRLLPLIVSPGLDGELGIEIGPELGVPGTNVNADPIWVQRANPYSVARVIGGNRYWLGSIGPAGDAADLLADNIHNHNVATLSQSR